MHPADLTRMLESATVFTPEGLRNDYFLPLPDFRDDLLVQIINLKKKNKSINEGIE